MRYSHSDAVKSIHVLTSPLALSNNRFNTWLSFRDTIVIIQSRLLVFRVRTKLIWKLSEVTILLSVCSPGFYLNGDICTMCTGNSVKPEIRDDTSCPVVCYGMTDVPNLNHSACGKYIQKWPLDNICSFAIINISKTGVSGVYDISFIVTNYYILCNWTIQTSR